MKIFSTKTENNGQVKRKVRLLLRKLGTTEHNRFVDFILPKKTIDLDFSETIRAQHNLVLQTLEIPKHSQGQPARFSNVCSIGEQAL